MGLTQYEEKAPFLYQMTITNASGTDFQGEFTSTLTGAFRLDAAIASSTDTADAVIDIAIYQYGYTPDDTMVAASAAVPASAGDGTVPAVDLLAAAFPSTQVGIPIPPGWRVAVRAHAALTSGKIVNILFVGGEL